MKADRIKADLHCLQIAKGKAMLAHGAHQDTIVPVDWRGDWLHSLPKSDLLVRSSYKNVS